MSSFKRLGSRVHPDGDADAASEKQLSRPASLRSQRSLRRGASGRARLSAAAAEQERAKGLLLPAEEHTAWLANKVRREGRQSAAQLFRFYLRMLGPVAILSVFFFGIAAGFSYAIPNLLCNRVAKENSVGWGLWSGQGVAWVPGDPGTVLVATRSGTGAHQGWHAGRERQPMPAGITPIGCFKCALSSMTAARRVWSGGVHQPGARCVPFLHAHWRRPAAAAAAAAAAATAAALDALLLRTCRPLLPPIPSMRRLA